MKKVNVYTDGSCLGNPGPGGWASILEYEGVEKCVSGGEFYTTNNRMELVGVIKALEILTESCEVVVTTDSKYVVDSVEKGWLNSWQRRGWKKSDGQPALNVDLWQELLVYLERHKVSFVWIKGHDGHPYNERCDTAAVSQSYRYKESNI